MRNENIYDLKVSPLSSIKRYAVYLLDLLELSYRELSLELNISKEEVRDILEGATGAYKLSTVIKISNYLSI